MNDQQDFLNAIAEYGFAPDVVRQVSENKFDQIEMPEGQYRFCIGPSYIEGKGVVCKYPININESVGPARIDGKRTPLGRYTNHSANPNAKMVIDDQGNINLVAFRNIDVLDEITVDYRQVLSIKKPISKSMIFAIENEIKRHPKIKLADYVPDGKFYQIDIEPKHYFSYGLYAREITIPQGAVLTGLIHKYPQINILSKGIIRVSLDSDIREIEAPYTVVSPAGTKRIAYAVTEVVWTTIIHTFETNIEKIDKEFFCYSEEEWQQFKQIEHNKCQP